MKLTYKIIWVEDKIDTRPFLSLIENVKQYLENEFFNVQIDTAEDFEEFRAKYVESEVYDLIITDLNLNESHGNEVIDFIRDEKHILTEIFFYSANSELSTTKLVNSSRITFYQLDGQDYHKELQSSLIEVINLTIAKFQNIISMRGMIMQETSSLDLKMDEIVNRQLANPSLSENITPLLNMIFDSIYNNAREKYNKAERRKVKEILGDNVLFNASQKVFALGEILKIMNEENFAPSYNEDVIKIRNQFAHAELKRNEDGKEFFMVRGTEVYFDKELCKRIRRNLNVYINKINTIEQKLNIVE